MGFFGDVFGAIGDVVGGVVKGVGSVVGGVVQGVGSAIGGVVNGVGRLFGATSDETNQTYAQLSPQGLDYARQMVSGSCGCDPILYARMHAYHASVAARLAEYLESWRWY